MMRDDKSDNEEAADDDYKQLVAEREKEQQQTDGDEENVRVMVRCRPPLGKKQPNVGHLRVVEAERLVEVGGRSFGFDQVFGSQASNEQVYMRSVRPLVESAFQGYNCTVFLYGQTGTGKTFTHSSLVSSAFAHLFSLIKQSNSRARFLIRASYYELYNEEIRDLLAPTSTSNRRPALELRESPGRGVYVKDLTCYLVSNQLELERLKRKGDRLRSTAATRMNEHSSRSHSIFSITIETVLTSAKQEQQQQQRKRANSNSQQQPVQVGRLNLIDLAGSERQSKSGSSGSQLKEAARINLSLTCLSLVIRALTDSGSSHVPYRNSKLTRLLSSSLGGNSKTLLIACISPAQTSSDETLNTLRFASRTKRIKNKATINEDAKDALLRKYRRQIEELRLKLNEQQQQQHQLQGDGGATNNDDQGDTNELVQQLRLLKGKIMIGGENLLEKVEIHEKLLEASRQELEEKRLEEQRLREKLEEKRRQLELMANTKGSLEGQVMELDEKLKRVVELYKRSQEELRDLASEHQQLKESLLLTIRATSKGIRYADCIIEDFIPREYWDLINAYARFDDESDEWQIKCVALSGNNMAQIKRISGRALEGQLKGSAASSSSSGGSGGTKLQSSSIGPEEEVSRTRLEPFIKLKDLLLASSSSS